MSNQYMVLILSTSRVNTRYVGINLEIIKIPKKSSDFCSFVDHTASSCATKKNIGKFIDGNKLVVLLQNTCPFEVIESDQYGNMFCVSLDISKT